MMFSGSTKYITASLIALSGLLSGKNAIGSNIAPETAIKKTAISIVKKKSTPAKPLRHKINKKLFKPLAVVSADKMNILYIGIDNPISVAVPGVFSDKISIAVTNGSSHKWANGHYNIRVDSLGTTQVTVYLKSPGGTKRLVGTTLFKTRRIPDPKAYFARISGGITNSVNLKVQNTLFAKQDYFGIDAHYSIIGFTLCIVKQGQEPVILSVNGANLTAEMKAATATLTTGTLLIFKDIVVACPDDNDRLITPIMLTAN